MHTSIQKYEFELFLEGVKVPFQSINMYSNNEGVSASISMPHDKNIRKVLPNTLVHLFYRRYNEDWKLMIDGYVVAVSESVSTGSSLMNLQCRDIFGNLDIMWKFYTNGTNPEDMQYKIVRHFGAPEDHTNLFERTGSEGKRKGDIAKSNSVMQLLENMIKTILVWKEDGVEKANLYFQSLYYASKFMERFFYDEDTQVSNILKKETLNTMLERSKFTALHTTRSIITSFLKKVYYKVAYISSPVYKNNKVHQAIMKPDNSFLPAPMCNLILPNMISSYDYSRNFSAEPTRLTVASDTAMALQPDGGRVPFQYMAYAPYELKNIVNRDTNVLHYDLINDEVYRGIYPVIEQIDQSVRMLGVELDLAKNASPSFSFKSMKYSADYMLQKKQTESRVFNAGECTFNPNLLVNYPAVVVKDPTIIMGNLTSVHHSIAAGGRVNTTFSMNYCRDFDSKLDNETLVKLSKMSNVEFDWSKPMEPDQMAKAKLIGEDINPYPFWLSDKFFPDKIDETYFNSIGCKSIMSKTSDPSILAKTEAVREILKLYKEYEKRDAGNIFSDRITYRSSITKDEFFEKFIGISKSKDDNDIYVNNNSITPAISSSYSYIKQDHQDIILKYKKNMNRGVVVA